MPRSCSKASRLLASVTVFLGLMWPVYSIGKPTPRHKAKQAQVIFYHVPAISVSKQEKECLAKNVYYEARGEGFTGMVGVAQVTLNRFHARFRRQTSICKVVYDLDQFSWTRIRQKDPHGKSWVTAGYIASLTLRGLRIRGLESSLHFARHTLTPRWSKHLLIGLLIGNHQYWVIPTEES